MTILKGCTTSKMKDEGCPTCGSKNFGEIEMKNEKGIAIWKKQCYSCKKFWYR